MNKASLSIFCSAILLCFVHTPAQAEAAESLQLSAGSTIPAMLEKGVDAKKNKVGDEVMARTTEHVKSEGQVVIPRGSRIVGHVTEVKPKTAAETESVVGIAFDHALLKDGRQIPLALDIQAIAPDDSGRPLGPSDIPAVGPLTAQGASPTPSGGGVGPMADPNAGTPGRVASQANGASAASSGLSPTGGLTPSCHGVLGIDGLGLVSETANSAEGSLIVSQRKNVHLDGRTQLMLRVTGK